MKSATRLKARLGLSPRTNDRKQILRSAVDLWLARFSICFFLVLGLDLSSTWAQSGPDVSLPPSQSPIATFNAGIEAMEGGKIGPALGLLRKARHLDPQLKQADQAIEFILTSQPRLASTLVSNPFHEFARLVQNLIPHWILIFSTAVCFLLSFGLSSRQRYLRIVLARAGEPGPKSLKSIPILYGATAVFGSALALWWFAIQPGLATVIEAKSHLAASPDPDATALVPLLEGQSLTIEKRSGDWVLARTSRGEGGWISLKSILPVEELPDSERL